MDSYEDKYPMYIVPSVLPPIYLEKILDSIKKVVERNMTIYNISLLYPFDGKYKINMYNNIEYININNIKSKIILTYEDEQKLLNLINFIKKMLLNGYIIIKSSLYITWLVHPQLENSHITYSYDYGIVPCIHCFRGNCNNRLGRSKRIILESNNIKLEEWRNSWRNYYYNL